jgi:hypothetical protein
MGKADNTVRNNGFGVVNTAPSALVPIRREYSAWVAWPISIGLVILLCTISSPIFDTNDDVHLSMIAHGYGIATGGSPLLVYSNVLWGHFIRLVPEIGGVQGYSLITLGIIVVVGAVVIRSVLATGIGVIAAIAVLTLVVARAVLIPQYTANAGLLMVAAVVCWHRFDRQASGGRLALCAGCVLAYCSFLVRAEAFLLVLGVALPLMPWRSLWLRRDAKVALILLVVAIGASSLLDHFAYRGAEWVAFNRFSAVRGPYNDYGAADHLKSKPDILRRYGYSANDVDLIADWFFEDPKIADPGKLRSILRELGPLAFQAGSLNKGWEGVSELVSSDKLLPIVLAAALLAVMRPRWRIFGVWCLCLAALFTLGVMGRPGMTRVYIPLVGLLLLAPFLDDGEVLLDGSAVRRWTMIVVVLVAAFFNARTVLDNSRYLQSWSEDVRAGLAHFPTDGVVVWGGNFPYEAVYPVLGSSPNFRNLHLSLLDDFTLAPYSVATAVRTSGHGFLDRFVDEKGVAVVVNDYGASLLEIYCRDNLHGLFDVVASRSYGQVWVTTFRCRVN